MMRADLLKAWLRAPPVTGGRAVLLTLGAFAVPTLIRASVDGMVSGVAFGPYFPFVLLSALLMGSRHALVLTLAAAVAADLLFVGPRLHFLEGATDIFGVGVFLLSSALIIGLVQAIRSALDDGRERDAADPPSGGIVFSLEGGEAWVSWYGAERPVRLGPQKEVAEMMADFLAQVELGQRLSRRG